MTILLRQPWEELVPRERTPWHWSKQVRFRPSWLFHKGCFSLHSWWDAMLARNGTCWVCDVLAFSLLQLSFNIHSSNGFSMVQLSYQVLSFENSHWAGLGRILAPACATTEKHWCPVSTFSYFRGKAFLGKPAKITSSKQGCKLTDQI